MVRTKSELGLGNIFGDRLLVLGAHPDDCELMAGGLLLRWKGPKKAVVVTTMRASHPVKQKIREREIALAMRVLGIREYEVGSEPDAALVHNAQLTRYFERIVDDFRPTLVITHKPDDFHQDHRAISFAAEAALRRSPASLCHGESYIWPLSSPSLYCNITAEMPGKLRALRAYRSIISNETFDPDAVATFHRMRGSQTFRFRYAEAFRITKAWSP